MNISIKTSNLDVIRSGLVSSFNNEPIEMFFDEHTNSEFLIRFRFIIDKTMQQNVKVISLSNQTEIEFQLTNFNNPLGTSIVKPVEFATDDNGKKLFIIFSVYTIGEASPTLQYTLYRER